jgi:hypothetical protein
VRSKKLLLENPFMHFEALILIAVVVTTVFFFFNFTGTYLKLQVKHGPNVFKSKTASVSDKDNVTMLTLLVAVNLLAS